MANTLKLGNGKWATGTDTVLAFNDENNNFKPMPLSFSRASSATVVNQSGLIETVGSGTPRIDFLGNTKGALLLEPTRTNYVPNSENMSAWNLQANIINSLNTDVIAPDGTLNGWKASRNINSNGYTYMTGVGLSTNTIYTASIWLKAYDVTICDAVVFNFHPNSFTSNSTTFSFETGIASGDGKVEKYSNGWYRLSLTSISNSTIGYFDIGLQPYLNGSNNWGGQDGDTLFYAYGTQLEQGSYATSYIPTSGQSGGVTRVAESNILGSPISLDNNFSLFWDGLVLESDIMLYGSGTNAWYMNYETVTGRIILDEPTSGGRKIQAYLGSGAPAGIKTKILLIRDGGVHSVFANGTKLTANISVNSTSTLSLSSMFWAFSSSFNKGLKVNDSQIFKIALTDAEAIALTTI
jgi:hypothetical protein